jgi:competence protein ComEC
VGLFMTLFSRGLGPNRGALLTIVVIAFYTVLVGASASVVRAAIMGSLGVIGQRLGRSGAGLNLLAAAAFGMTLFNPLTLWDVGFQLSAAATMGLILYGDALKTGLQSWLEKRLAPSQAARLANFASDLFLLTLAAQITTLPILAYTFRQVSIISLVANILILPVQPAVMILGGVALLLGLVWLPLGQVAAWLAYPFTAYTLAFVDVFARVPGASLALGDVAPALVLIFYAALFGYTWLSRKPAEARPSWWARLTQEFAPVGGLAALSLVAFYAWGSFFTLPQAGQLTLTVLNVGEGEAVLVQTPSGQHAILNGGPSGNVLVRALSQNLPLFTSHLDLLVVGAVQDENIGGLPDMLERYRVGQVALTQATRGGAAYRTLSAALSARTVPVHAAANLPTYNLGAGAQLKILLDGERGSVVRVEWQRFSALVPLNLRDVNVAELPPSTVLLLTQATLRSLTVELVQAVNPTVVILSAEAGTHLTPEQSALLTGRTILATAERGTIKLITDGVQLWAEGER